MSNQLGPDDRPRLRPYLAASPDSSQPGIHILHDQVRVSDTRLSIGPIDLEILKRMGGKTSIREIQQQIQQELGQKLLLPLPRVLLFMEELENALFLDSPAFHRAIQAPVRKPSCIGCYEAHPKAFKEQMGELFARSGPPKPFDVASDHLLRGLIVPHMDYARGEATYAHAFHHLMGQTNAKIFVILATSHYSGHPISLTRKHFQSPLGIIPTDIAYVDRIADHLGDWAFQDEVVAHFPEHSVELEAVLLHYLRPRENDFRIVPIVLGNIDKAMRSGQPGEKNAVLSKILKALRAAEAEANEPVCYLLSGDLAHIGPKFEDPVKLDKDRIVSSRGRDRIVLNHLVHGSANDFLTEVASEGNSRNICGVAPFWYGLKLMGEHPGSLIHYQQFIDPKWRESVSFASVAYPT
jgi:AmmeMemoRadiSam system protein B